MKMTQKETDEQIKKINESYEKLKAALLDAQVPTLVRQIESLNRSNPPHRFPIGYIGDPDGHGQFSKAVQPSVTCRPMQLVLSEETAAAYDIVSIQVSNVMGNIGDCQLPGELFSVKFLSEKKELTEVMQFDIAWATPVNQIGIYASLKKEEKRAIPFRGIMWCGVTMDFGFDMLR